VNDAFERRLADVVREYDAQGNHRTGTAVDAASLEWLAARVRAIGLEPQFEPLHLARVDVDGAYLKIGSRCIGGVPLFDGSFTPPAGIGGSLGLFGTTSEIGLAAAGKAVPGDWAHEHRPSLAQIRSSKHKAIVLVTCGDRAGLTLQNASSFRTPDGPPVIQVSSTEGAWLRAQASEERFASVVLDATRSAAESSNLLVELSGTEPRLPHVVITTPRTGWWQCASERGGGLACWLEMMSLLASSPRRRACHFAAFAGHELGLLGGHEYASRRPELLARAHWWLHFGANIGAAGQTFRIQASDAAAAGRAVEAFSAEGETSVERASPDLLPRGEAIVPHRAGIRYIAPICASDVFHHPSDRWPDVVDVSTIARCARACGRLGVDIASGNGE
jgi:hypothetical protein